MDQEFVSSVTGSHAVSINGQARQIRVVPGRTVLDQAEEQGLNLPSGCRSGGCGACKAKVTSGSYSLGTDAIALSQDDQQAGYVLLCQTFARSDLQVALENEEQPARTARIQTVEYPEATVAKLRLEVEGGDFKYMAGQHVDLVLKDGTKRTYSIANRFEGDRVIELHIRLVEGGRFTARLGGESPAIRSGMRLRLSSARGDFFLRPLARELVMVATGTGYAPIRAMLQELEHADNVPALRFYWGARTRRELYAHEEALQVLSRLGGTYVPVLSDLKEASAHGMRAGLVHLAVLDDFVSLNLCDVYACGAPPMIKAAKADFVVKAGLPVERFFADAFTPTA